MKKNKNHIRDVLFTLGVLSTAFVINLILQELFKTPSPVFNVFILAVFLIALKTQGYLWGILASLVSVLAVNFAFTFPYFAFDFYVMENLASAVVMLIVAVVTSTLTTQIKEQERTRAEIEKERMRANLLRAISHDLRTPLTTIYGSCSALIENYDFLKKEQHLKLLEELREDSEWLIRMVENLLSVTRIDGEKVQVMKTPTVLEELIDAVLLKFHKRYPLQNVMVSIPDEFISIPMDAMLIEQVLINLLENAVLHAKGMTKLSLNVTEYGQLAIFEVTDDGCGIAEEKLEDLFTGYLDRQNTPLDGGRNNMSIGLSVCATIIKAHNGEIYGGNNSSGGASFWFSLEMEAVTDDNEQI